MGVGREAILWPARMGEGSAPPITVLMRAKWLMLLLLAVYTLCAGTCYSFSRFGFFVTRSQGAFLALSICVVVIYNLSYQQAYAKLSPFRFFHHLQILIDTFLVTVLIHFSGGAASWLWPLYLVVTIEAVYLLERREEICCAWLGAAFSHGTLLFLEHGRLLPHIAMPFVDQRVQDDVLYLLLIWFFATVFNAAIAIIGCELMSALRGETQILRESEERLYSFLNRTNDLIHSNAPDGSFLYANDAWLRTMGYCRDHLDFLTVEDVLHPESLQRYREELDRVLSGGESRSCEHLYIARNGAPVAVEGNLSCTYDGAAPVAVWGIGRDIGERKRAQEELYHRAHHDPLTGLPNRLLFLDRLRQMRAVSQRMGQRMALLYLDLDRFKWVNDTLGHGVGDKLLQEVAQRLSACVRETDTVARIGGDEFVIALGQLRDSHGAEVVARKVLAALEPPCLVDHHSLQAGVSIGISIYPDDSDELEELMRKADVAMYFAKEKGRGGYRSYSRELSFHTETLLADALEQALERGELRIYYQPKVEVVTGQVSGVEALVRWEHPRFGLLTAAQFLPLAEKAGLLEPIGRWVLERACQQNRKWQEEGGAPLRVAVNLSLCQLKQGDLVDRVRDAVAKAGLDPHLLELEVAESALIDDPEYVKGVLAALSRLGVGVVLDDYTRKGEAAGLKLLGVRSLKIDSRFTAALEDSDAAAQAASSIIDLGSALKLRVTAEGVETQGQLLFFQRQGCHELQGYFVSRPLPPERVLDFVRGGVTELLWQDSSRVKDESAAPSLLAGEGELTSSHASV
ncbi:EAL domain-containing protein [Geomonas sp. RF6]|uniref:putative bifunctional diguanylate cyclase/phosphodiesterase n=1 Tax=Geomonas sp. RF6 TaxID=2897342 RepID=UPI001E4EA1A3|nr:EAL domain-containing protein [Geomonas sp. RF6]UFS69664.1 EAL domain-containing protein [Geomonas sp. RF6]